MVKVLNITQGQVGEIIAELFADSKDDALTNIIGMPEGARLGAGSSMITSAGDFAFLRSDGIWNWI